jgi:hypothetical protein
VTEACGTRCVRVQMGVWEVCRTRRAEVGHMEEGRSSVCCSVRRGGLGGQTKTRLKVARTQRLESRCQSEAGCHGTWGAALLGLRRVSTFALSRAEETTVRLTGGLLAEEGHRA